MSNILDDLVVGIDQVDDEQLELCFEMISEADLFEEAPDISELDKKERITTFAQIVEHVQQNGNINDLPDECIELYNFMFTEQKNTEPATQPADDDKKGAKAKGKDKSGKKRQPPQRPKDKFGFVEGSTTSKFASAIEKSPMTMAEVKKADWNPNKNTFYDAFNKLVERGFGVKDDKGRMSIRKK